MIRIKIFLIYWYKLSQWNKNDADAHSEQKYILSFLNL